MRLSGWLLAIGVVLFQGLTAVVHIEEATNPPPCRPPEYKIDDMGQTDVDPSLMKTISMPHSYAPRINNNRQVSANRVDEGFFREIGYGELVPQIGYCLRGHAFGLNDVGDIIATLARSRDNVDWYVWTQTHLQREKRFPVQPCDGIAGVNVDLRAINNDKWAVGYINPGEVLRPAVWNPRWGLKPFGFYVGWDFKGCAFGVSEKGTIVGYVTECDETPPFVWNEKCGLEILRNYRTAFEAQSCYEIHGPVRFADMVITEDNYVYGTLWIDNDYYHDDGKIRYHAYRWEPYSHNFRYIDMDGMRINAVNQRHTLVGSIDGEAALRERGERPVLLRNYLKDDEWELIEATDINDKGDIVGYGKYHGSLHVFMMTKE